MRWGLRWSVLLLVLGAAGWFGPIRAARAQTYRPSFHPDTLKGPPAGTPNRVLVLGTPHLSGLPKSFTPAMLAPLLDRLAAWRPTAIATEDLSGLQCHAMRQYPARYAESIESYCPDPAAAARATGLGVPAANAEAERLLADWPAAPSAAERRRLAAIFLAAGERHSALVQWLRLAPADRRAGDSLTAELVGSLDALKDRRNETSLVAAVLAARLGLERLWSVDDHTADRPEGDAARQKAYGAAITAAWDNPVNHRRAALYARQQGDLVHPGGLMRLYAALNDPDQATMIYGSDFGAALKEPSREQFGRGYVGYWETRNLRMVANIRDVLAQQPGSRLLAIVGASHKPYYEAYLDQMHDVELVDARAVLR